MGSPTINLTDPDQWLNKQSSQSGLTDPDAWLKAKATEPAAIAPEEKSVGGFLHNVASSGLKFAGDVVSPVLHPVQTVENVAGLLQGMTEASGGKPAAGVSHQQNVDALVKAYKDKYGGWDQFKNSLYTDPVGVAADISALASGVGLVGKGVGVAADLAKLGDVADAARTVSRGAGVVADATNPISVAGKVADATGLPAAAGKLSDAAADALTRKSLRTGHTENTPAEDVNAAAQTMRAGAIPMSQAGLTKISDALTEIRKNIVQKASDAAKAGVTIDPQNVQLRLDELRNRYGMQVNPDPDLKEIDKVANNFSRNNPKPIPADQAQMMKVGSNQLNSAKYGKASVAQIEAEKALTRGLKEELEAQIPELGSLNAEQAKLINLDGMLSKAVNRYTNSGGFLGNLQKSVFSKTGLEIGGASGLATHDPMVGVSAAVLQGVLSDPMVKSKLAIAISKARQANPGKWGSASMANAISRVNDYNKSLDQLSNPQQ